LYRTNPTDPEYRFQYARGLGNFGLIERCYTGNLDHAMEMLTQSQELQLGLAREFSEVKTFHFDLAYTDNSLAEVSLWLAAAHPDKRGEYVDLCRKSADSAGKIYGQFHRAGDANSVHGLAWRLVTLAALDQLENGPDTVRLAEEAASLLENRPGGALTLGRRELVTLALASSLQGDVKAAYAHLKDALDRGENTAERFEKLGQTGLRALATDTTFGPQFHELCRRVRQSLKSD